jgi:hypothetical protein
LCRSGDQRKPQSGRHLKSLQFPAAAKPPLGQTTIQLQIAASDRQIGQLVYELYGLTEEEIRLVEEGTAN